MRNVYQFATFDLCMAFFQPAYKRLGIKFCMTRQRLLKEMQNEMQEIRFVIGIPAVYRIHHPIRRACRKDLRTCAPQMPEQMAPASAVSARCPPVHRLVIQPLDLRIQPRIDRRLERRHAVEVDRQPCQIPLSAITTSVNDSGIGSRSKNACAINRSAGSLFFWMKSKTSACSSWTLIS